MSLKLNERYPGRFDNPSPGYPQGSFKNRTAPGALDGSYLEKDWANDKEGFFQSLLSAAGFVPNGTVDAVGSSQYYDALTAIIGTLAPSPPDASTTVKGIVELATSAETQTGTDSARAVTPAGMQSRVQTSAYSATSGKLMPVGAFGVGSTYVDSPVIPTDFNGSQVAATGIYRYNTSSTGRPTFGTGYGSILHSCMAQDGAGNYGTELAIDYTSNSIGFRRLAGASGWQPWFEIFHSGNLVQATEAALGIAALATQAKTNAVTDDLTVVTPKKLGNGFSMLKAANGYLILPSWLGGFILQWGVTTSGQTSVTFPVPFPSLCATVIPIGTNTTVVNIPTAKTNSGFTLNSGTSGGTYFAIGY